MNETYEFNVKKEFIDDVFKKSSKKRIEADIARAIKGLDKSLDKVSLVSVKMQLSNMKEALIKEMLEKENEIKIEAKDRVKIKNNIIKHLEKISSKIDNSIDLSSGFKWENMEFKYENISFSLDEYDGSFIIKINERSENVIIFYYSIDLRGTKAINFYVTESFACGTQEVLKDNEDYFYSKMNHIDLETINKYLIVMKNIYKHNRVSNIDYLFNKYFVKKKIFKSYDEFNKDLNEFKEIVLLSEDITIK